MGATVTGLPVLVGDLQPNETNHLLLRILAWMRRTGQPARVVSRLDGSIRNEFEDVAEVHVANDWSLRDPATALQAVRLHRPAEIARSRRLRRHMADMGPVALLAGLGATPLLDWLPARTTVVGHIPWVDEDALDEVDEPQRRILETRVASWLAGSDHAAARLRQDLGVAEDRIIRFEDPLPPSKLWPQDPPTASRAERNGFTRKKLEELYGIPVDAPLICSRGRVDFWQVSDVFAQLCWNLLLSDPGAGAHCLWIGEGSTDRMVWPLLHDVRHAGLEGRVHVHLPNDDPRPLECVAASDVHVLTNRQPVDPEVIRDSRAVGTPTVGFALAGGGDEGLATTVPWIDVGAMGAVVSKLLADPSERRRLGAQDPSRPASWDVRSGGPFLLELLAAQAGR